MKKLEKKFLETLNRINEIEKIISEYDITDSNLIFSLREEINEHQENLKSINNELNLLRNEKFK